MTEISVVPDSSGVVAPSVGYTAGMIIVGQTSLPQIAIVEQICFMVLHDSYTYFRGPIEEFYEEKKFTKLQLVVFTRLQQQFVL